MQVIPAQGCSVWAVIIIMTGAILVCIGEREGGMMLVGGGLALLQHKTG
jgi:hypothetical protein